MVSPRKSRRKSSCFSSTTMGTPARASKKPSIIPAGPPPAMQHVVRMCPIPAPAPTAALTFEPGRHVLVFAFELHAGGERHGFGERGEILLQIFFRIGLERRRAEMALQHLARGRRHWHRHVPLAAKPKTEVEVLAQKLRRERRGPV